MAMPEEQKEQTFQGFTVSQIMAHQIQKRPSIWAQAHTKLKGKPYRFEQLNRDGTPDLRRPYQIKPFEVSIGLRGQRQFLQQPLDDQHPHKALQKSRQCGASENEVRETLWFGDVHPHTKQCYVFPTFDQVADFSRTRIEEVMRESPHIKSRMGFDPVTGKKVEADVIDNVRLRRIGRSFIFFRSGHTPKAGEGIDVDKVTFDEIDRMHPKVTIAFNETLTSSSYGWRRDISTPSLPGVGVNESFKKSDQQHWFMKCPHCNHWFTLIHDFPKCVIELPKNKLGIPNHDYHNKYSFIDAEDTHAYICMKCHRFISDETRINGIWRPLYSYKNRVRGYQISQLICAWISPTQLMAKKEDYKLEQLFENYVIGRPYLGDNVMVTRGDVLRCVDMSMKDPYAFTLDRVGTGTDWGNISWGLAGMLHPDGSGRIILLDIWTIEDAEAIVTEGKKDNPHIRKSAQKMRQWKADRGVYDAGYGKDRNWDLMQEFPGRVFSCFYPTMKTSYTKRMDELWNDDEGTINVDRTMTLKLTANLFREGKVVIPAWVASNPLFETFIKHVTNLVLIRDIETDEKTKKEVITERVGTLPGGDHYGHAMNYLSIALRRLKEDDSKSDFFM